MKIWTVDAFTNKPFAGNPAAVTIVNEFPDNDTCQKIAAEMNLSETAFVKPLADDHFHIRWFTPVVEAKLCGHATLASAHILYQEKLIKGDTMRFDSLSGPLLVYKSVDGLTLDFPLHTTGPELDIKQLQEIFPAKIIAAVQALDDIIIELEDEASVRSLVITPQKINQIDCRAVIVTAKADKQYDIVSRFFAPKVGINEDPVTGSAHCKLADYWHKKLGKTQLFAYQASPRGGELRLAIKGSRVHITGQAVTIVAGQWLAT